MKLTAEVIESAAQYINPATRDRELDLRAFKISMIENLGASLDQFDCIDFSDNDIRKFDGFPLLTRLKTILLNNNRIARIADHLEESLPNLRSIILTNNNVQELGDIDTLGTLPKLQCLSLLNNPITTKKHYRHYVINKLPNIRLLDFRKIKMKERVAAEKLFKGTKGKQLEREIGIKSKTFIPGAADLGNAHVSQRPVHTPADVEAIKAAIGKAQTLEEIERLNQLLKSGYIPGRSDVTVTTPVVTKKSHVPEEDDDKDEVMEVTTDTNGR